MDWALSRRGFFSAFGSEWKKKKINFFSKKIAQFEKKTNNKLKNQNQEIPFSLFLVVGCSQSFLRGQTMDGIIIYE